MPPDPTNGRASSYELDESQAARTSVFVGSDTKVGLCAISTLMSDLRMTPPAVSDAELLSRSDEDASAFAELYSRHVREVYRWCAARITWAASDLTAEAFARAWLSRRRFRDPGDGSALPWLIGIASNLLADAARHDRIETRARDRLGLPADLAFEEGYTEVEQRLSPRLALANHLRDLAPHERDALELRVIEELPYDEVAERLAITPAAARLRVSRALRRLARSVPKE
jgi:RNA polymerase sigma factor (sigma-70 family)